MIYLEAHWERIFLIPTIILEAPECEDETCDEFHWFVGISFLFLTFGFIR